VIFEEIIESFDNLWTYEKEFSLFDMFSMIFIRNLKVQLKYKFFYLEINNLLNNDKDLKKRFIEVQDFRLNNMENLIEVLIDFDLLKEEEIEGSYRNILELIWFISNFGMLQINLFDKDLDIKVIEKKVFFIIDLFYPYLTKAGLEEYHKFKEQLAEKENLLDNQD